MPWIFLKFAFKNLKTHFTTKFRIMKSLFRTLVMALCGAMPLAAMAVPAKPGPMQVTQADGSTITIRLYGDEYHHFCTTDDGYLLTSDNGIYCYADVDAQGRTISSGLKASDAAARTAEVKAYLKGTDMTRVLGTMDAQARTRRAARGAAARIAAPAFAQRSTTSMQKGPGLFPGTHFPPKGKQKGLVILVEYNDVSMSKRYDPLDYFTRMLNEPGFSDLKATGSAVDFFRESSCGQFEPEFDVYGPVKLSRDRSYYGGNNFRGDDLHPEDMVKEACELLDDEIDFSEYDRDGDGVVDNVFVFYAGGGEASGGGADTVWPHAWYLSEAYDAAPEFDGVAVDRYACSNEWEGNRPDGVGTFVHEFSHVMGLPDLYATEYTSSFTPGSWSCMDYGPYNNNGMTPPLYGAFERYALGWLTPTEIDSSRSVMLPPIGNNVAGIIKASRNEFFLLENRQQTGWDTYIPGHGMLVWHIDYDDYVWTSNTVNNTPSHQYVDIEEADGTQSEYTRDGDAFPGTGNNTSFTDNTRPNMKTWSNRKMNLPLTGITESASGMISFDVDEGSDERLDATTALTPASNDETALTATWTPVEGAIYALTVYRDATVETKGTDGAEAEREYVLQDLCVGDATTYCVEGLEPGTVYHYYVRVLKGLDYSAPSNVIDVLTSGESGIQSAITDPKGPFTIYDLTGRRVGTTPDGSIPASLTRGVYLLRSNNGTTNKIKL